ncbi:mitogen-activated protein kinase kinase kinase [Malassezia sp. CBS 17886]|nr:mitogen-activated protein kinase kinase kinase [Malassezia sp. CBS 17886]
MHQPRRSAEYGARPHVDATHQALVASALAVSPPAPGYDPVAGTEHGSRSPRWLRPECSWGVGHMVRHARGSSSPARPQELGGDVLGDLARTGAPRHAATPPWTGTPPWAGTPLPHIGSPHRRAYAHSGWPSHAPVPVRMASVPGHDASVGAQQRPFSSTSTHSQSSQSSSEPLSSTFLAGATDRVLIQATLDNEHFSVVNVSGVDSAPHIKECIFRKLQLPAGDLSQWSLHRTEIGYSDLAAAPVDDDTLLALCLQLGDDKGTVKFLVQRAATHPPAHAGAPLPTPGAPRMPARGAPAARTVHYAPAHAAHEAGAVGAWPAPGAVAPPSVHDAMAMGAWPAPAGAPAPHWTPTAGIATSSVQASRNDPYISALFPASSNRQVAQFQLLPPHAQRTQLQPGMTVQTVLGHGGDGAAAGAGPGVPPSAYAPATVPALASAPAPERSCSSDSVPDAELWRAHAPPSLQPSNPMALRQVSPPLRGAEARGYGGVDGWGYGGDVRSHGPLFAKGTSSTSLTSASSSQSQGSHATPPRELEAGTQAVGGGTDAVWYGREGTRAGGFAGEETRGGGVVPDEARGAGSAHDETRGAGHARAESWGAGHVRAESWGAGHAKEEPRGGGYARENPPKRTSAPVRDDAAPMDRPPPPRPQKPPPRPDKPRAASHSSDSRTSGNLLSAQPPSSGRSAYDDHTVYPLFKSNEGAGDTPHDRSVARPLPMVPSPVSASPSSLLTQDSAARSSDLLDGLPVSARTWNREGPTSLTASTNLSTPASDTPASAPGDDPRALALHRLMQHVRLSEERKAEGGADVTFDSFSDDTLGGTFAQSLDASTLTLPVHDGGTLRSERIVQAARDPESTVTPGSRPVLTLSIGADGTDRARSAGAGSAGKPAGDAALSSAASVARVRSFGNPDAQWAFRPPAEQLYEQLDDLFPRHDLDRPLAESALSPGNELHPGRGTHTNGVYAETLPPPLPRPALRGLSRAQNHSIRVIAQNRKKFLESTKREEHPRRKGVTGAALDRRRSTKLWGGRMVEMKTNAPDSVGVVPSGRGSPEEMQGRPTFQWVKGDLIGKGTFGRVYLALNATTGEMIAVKQVELPHTESDRDSSRQRGVVAALKSEIEALKDLDHANVVTCLGFEETKDNLSIFLEYVPGGSIGSCLRKHGKLEEATVSSFLNQTLQGLSYLHKQGILHRDLKADNLLVDYAGMCKISDFGTVRRSEDIYSNVENMSLQGSIFWMAPEMMSLTRKGYSAKVDIWSLGCVALEMLAGRRPWSDEEAVQAMFKIGAERRAPPVPPDCKISKPAAHFLRNCFEIDPDRRPTAARLLEHVFAWPPPDWRFERSALWRAIAR